MPVVTLRSRNVASPALAAGVVQLTRLAVHAAALPVTLDDDARYKRAIDLIAPTSIRIAVEAIRHRCGTCRSRDGRSQTSAEKKREGDRCHPSLQAIPEHQDSFYLSSQRPLRWITTLMQRVFNLAPMKGLLFVAEYFYATSFIDVSP